MLLALTLAAAASARTETLAWLDPSTTPVAGFLVYVGPSSGVYDWVLDVGLPESDGDEVFSYDLEVADYAAIYVALTAYDALDRESDFSNEQLRAPVDSDADGIPDDGVAGFFPCAPGQTSDCDDNCVTDPNGPLIPDAGGNAQLDVDGDGIGNVCDCDFNQDGGCGQPDLSGFLTCFGLAAGPGSGCEVCDMNGDGGVGQLDYSLFIIRFGGTPGP